ncbi:MAG: UDP-N-acetylmuramoyl-tripeptide--D-alanyl-D-alanine ligase, partial [Chloroflexi bacterium]|nr:UDP-N-acetylmuramoyl-tripeptide--D-alanyl-D-alanine ligase [Chloroflexota bacterium]
MGEACRIVDARLIPPPAGGGEEAEVRTVTHDSRRVGPGALFVAIPGATTDGHLFVDEAFSRGAVAALVAREPPGHPRGPCLLVPDTVAALGKLAL